MQLLGHTCNFNILRNCQIVFQSDCKILHFHESSSSSIVKVKSLSRVRLFATLWTVAYQAPLSMGFSRQQCWSGLPFPSPGDLPNPKIEPGSPALQADAFLPIFGIVSLDNFSRSSGGEKPWWLRR